MSGEGALNTLERLCTAPMDNPIGTSKYSLMLNESGGIEADITGDLFLLCHAIK